jgi:hypothetical protein
MTDTVEPAVATAEVSSIRTVYLSVEDHESLHAIARIQETSASALVRSFLDDYLNGDLTVAKIKPKKTTVWVDPQFWDEVRAKTTVDGIAIAQVIQAGMTRLRGDK